ncbi:Actin-like protein arp8 [Paramarasmius palmivorus]|uniref:Actin-like protein arp8 n=1 Tax=Paramarasmius palmivorus TaxID=297713 RepID=A0AAW0DYI6_9AGAR
MPRGIPNARRDESGLKYTVFHVPLATNPKHLGSTYLKSENQTIWHRNAKSKQSQEEGTSPEARRGSQVLVIHPGSRYLRIGRASDVNPVTVPNVIARRTTGPVSAPTFVEGVSRPRKTKKSQRQSGADENVDEYAITTSSDDPFEEKVSAILSSLRDRMRFYKLRVTPNASNIATTFNEQFKPEYIQEHNDPYRIEWITDNKDEALVGEKALQIADPQASNYIVRWPIYGPKFNTRDYPSVQAILGDLETILRHTLKDRLNIEPKDYNATTFGAGISSACVVDIGAKTTSIACVDEGLVIPDTRMTLNMGGDDITELFYVLLNRIGFPYRELNLARSYDWNVIDTLKCSLCTLSEVDVALNLYDFVVRKPGQPAEKYGLRTYDEIILAPMVIFEPRVIEFDRKRVGFLDAPNTDVTEEILESSNDHVTSAMMISTQHLMPGPSSTIEQNADQKGGLAILPTNLQGAHSAPQLDSVTQEVVTPAGAAEGDSTAAAVPSENSTEAPMEVVDIEDDSKSSVAQQSPSKNVTKPPTPELDPAFPGAFGIDVYFEASKLPLDVAIYNSARAAGGDEKIRKYLQAVLVVGGTANISGMAHALDSRYDGVILLFSSPTMVALTLALPAQIGRLQAISTPLVSNMEKVQIIPPPKDVDPQVLVWKGAAVLGKMDGASELWVTPQDWVCVLFPQPVQFVHVTDDTLLSKDVLGMRGLKERCFYL